MQKTVKLYLYDLIEVAVYENQKQFENFDWDKMKEGDEIKLNNGGVVYYGFTSHSDIFTLLSKKFLGKDWISIKTPLNSRFGGIINKYFCQF